MAKLHDKKDFDSVLLYSHSLSFKIYKMCITANIRAFTFKVVKNQTSAMFFRLRMMLKTRVSYTLFVARQRYQRGIVAMVLK